MIHSGQFAQLANGIRLHYASSGAPGAPLVLLLHGFPQYWGAWEELLPVLGERYYAVAPDLRGFNLSSAPPEVEAYRATELVRDIALLVRHLGYERADLVAHDWGGALAWNLAIAQPALVRRLVILNSPHPIPFARALADHAAQQKASAYMNWLRVPGAEGPLAENDCARLVEFFSSMQRPERRWLTPERLRRYRAVWSRGLAGGLNYYRASPLYPPVGDDPGARRLQLDARDFLVRVPTLVIWGMADHALLPTLLDELPALVSQLTVERLDHATHWLIHEEPQFVAQRIAAFLSAA